MWQAKENCNKLHTYTLQCPFKLYIIECDRSVVFVGLYIVTLIFYGSVYTYEFFYMYGCTSCT